MSLNHKLRPLVSKFLEDFTTELAVSASPEDIFTYEALYDWAERNNLTRKLDEELKKTTSLDIELGESEQDMSDEEEETDILDDEEETEVEYDEDEDDEEDVESEEDETSFDSDEEDNEEV